MKFYDNTLSLEDAKAAYKLFKEYPGKAPKEIIEAYDSAQALLRNAGIKRAHARPTHSSSCFFAHPDKDKTPLTAKPSRRPK